MKLYIRSKFNRNIQGILNIRQLFYLNSSVCLSDVSAICMTMHRKRTTTRNTVHSQKRASFSKSAAGCFFGVIKLNQDAFVLLRPDDNKSAASFQQA